MRLDAPRHTCIMAPGLSHGRLAMGHHAAAPRALGSAALHWTMPDGAHGVFCPLGAARRRRVQCGDVLRTRRVYWGTYLVSLLCSLHFNFIEQK